MHMIALFTPLTLTIDIENLRNSIGLYNNYLRKPANLLQLTMNIDMILKIYRSGQLDVDREHSNSFFFAMVSIGINREMLVTGKRCRVFSRGPLQQQQTLVPTLSRVWNLVYTTLPTTAEVAP